MRRRNVLLALLAVELSVGAVLYRGGWLSRTPQSPAPPPLPAVVAEPPTPARTTRVTAVDVRRGDTLVRALTRQGIEREASAGIAAALAAGGANLKKLSPRHTLEVTSTLDGRPVALRYEPSPWLGYVVVATDGGWEVRRAETRRDVRVDVVAGEVTRSLFEAVEDAGGAAQLAVELAAIFESDFDFTADTRAGDRFRLLVEKRFANDTFVDYGRILVAQYVSDGRVLTGVGFERAGDTRLAFYDLQGRSLRKSFLKSPLEFTRITSGFTWARPHPILGGVRPHLAIDYGAPTGTPVRAVADGRVGAAGWAGGNGISVTLKHRSGYETMYNHLSRLAAGVRPGGRVTQRQVIGYVG
ncbi:MAG TPA: M23 family metallopeptidase, partial [Methylomirabilota bacterium]